MGFCDGLKGGDKPRQLRVPVRQLDSFHPQDLEKGTGYAM